MLATVKHCMEASPFISFEQYFANYVMQVQDSSIEYELQFVLRNNFLDVRMMDRLIDSSITRCY